MYMAFNWSRFLKSTDFKLNAPIMDEVQKNYHICVLYKLTLKINEFGHKKIAISQRHFLY